MVESAIKASTTTTVTLSSQQKQPPKAFIGSTIFARRSTTSENISPLTTTARDDDDDVVLLLPESDSTSTVLTRVLAIMKKRDYPEHRTAGSGCSPPEDVTTTVLGSGCTNFELTESRTVLSEIFLSNKDDSDNSTTAPNTPGPKFLPSMSTIDLTSIDPSSLPQKLNGNDGSCALASTGGKSVYTSSVTVSDTLSPRPLHIEASFLRSRPSFYDPFPTPHSVTSPAEKSVVSHLAQQTSLLDQAQPLTWDDEPEHDDVPWLPLPWEDEKLQQPRESMLKQRRALSNNSVATAATADFFDSDDEVSTGVLPSPLADGSKATSSFTRDPFPGRHSTTQRRRRVFFPTKTQRTRVSRAVRSTIQSTSKRLRTTSRNIRQNMKIPPCRPAAQQTRFIIRSDHPLKVFWDVCTVLLSIISAYLTHTSIRERNYDQSGFLIRFCEVWFLLDILLNFITQHRTYRYVSNGHQSVTLDTHQHIWARYLTTWFIIDIISFLPWEKLWVKPIVEMQKRRNILQKTGRRSKVVFKITRALRGRHVKWFQKISKQTRHIGYGGKQLLRLIFKYTPKYFIFCKTMKAILAVRFLRQVHWVRKILKNLSWKKNGAHENIDSLTNDEEEDEDELGEGDEHEEDELEEDDEDEGLLLDERMDYDENERDDDDMASLDSRLHNVQEVPVTPVKDRLSLQMQPKLSYQAHTVRRLPVLSFDNDDPIGY
jgi:hypothetical protein